MRTRIAAIAALSIFAFASAAQAQQALITQRIGDRLYSGTPAQIAEWTRAYNATRPDAQPAASATRRVKVCQNGGESEMVEQVYAGQQPVETCTVKQPSLGVQLLKAGVATALVVAADRATDGRSSYGYGYDNRGGYYAGHGGMVAPLPGGAQCARGCN
jgi:hypothetical protein